MWEHTWNVDDNAALLHGNFWFWKDGGQIEGVPLFGVVVPVNFGGDRVPNLVPSPLEILVVAVRVNL